MNKQKVIIGNWKMNKTKEETLDFLKSLKKLLKVNKSQINKNIKYGLAVPFTSLDILSNTKFKGDFIISSQNISQFENGAFTGEISASIAKSFGANTTIIGHSERRQYFGETDQIVNEKIKIALKHGLTPVLCVGETLVEYEKKQTETIIKNQVKKAFEGLNAEEIKKIIIAYEPIWAIGTGKTATSEYAETICKFIRSITFKEMIIQYGGSVKPENINELMNQENIDGALVGGASTDVNSFVKLLTLNN